MALMENAFGFQPVAIVIARQAMLAAMAVIEVGRFGDVLEGGLGLFRLGGGGCNRFFSGGFFGRRGFYSGFFNNCRFGGFLGWHGEFGVNGWFK